MNTSQPRICLRIARDLAAGEALVHPYLLVGVLPILGETLACHPCFRGMNLPDLARAIRKESKLSANRSCLIRQ